MRKQLIIQFQEVEKQWIGYHKIMTSNILPYLKKNMIIYFRQITEDVLTNLIKNVNGNYSKRQTYIVLSMIFQYAIKKHKIKDNPLEHIDKPKVPKKKSTEKRAIIPSDRIELWCNKLEEESKISGDMYLLFNLLLMTRITSRRTDVGLRWCNLQKHVLVIDNAYKDFIEYDEDYRNVKGHYREDDFLKTATSYRKIPISDRLYKLLLLHKEEQKQRFKNSIKMKKKDKKWAGENEYIFLGRYFEPYVPSSLPKGMRQFYKKYGLEPMTPYRIKA